MAATSAIADSTSLTIENIDDWAADWMKREVVGQPGDHLAGGFPGQARVVGVDDVREGGLLQVGHHARHDARGDHIVQVDDDAAGHGDDDDGRHHPRQGTAVALEQGVERIFDDERIAAGGGGQATGEDESHRDLPPAREHPVVDEAAQRTRAAGAPDRAGCRLTSWCSALPPSSTAPPPRPCVAALPTYQVGSSQATRAQPIVQADNCRAGTSVPIPKFATHCRPLPSELRNHEGH